METLEPRLVEWLLAIALSESMVSDRQKRPSG